jgi:hypothetical protein
VTLAESERDGFRALVLARSLKRTLTTRKLTVLISEHVSQPMK